MSDYVDRSDTLTAPSEVPEENRLGWQAVHVAAMDFLNEVRLTPQQADLIEPITNHFLLTDAGILILEGVSGVGKSTLIHQIAIQNRLRLFELEERAYDRDLENVPKTDIVVVDYRSPEQASKIVNFLRDRVNHIVFLAHPVLKSGVKEDRARNLKEEGIETVQHKLVPMNDQQAVDYALLFDPKAHLERVKQYGLGLAGHIQVVLKSNFDKQRLNLLTQSKLRQILTIGGSCIGGTAQKASALLGKFLPETLVANFDRYSFDNLECRLAMGLGKLDFIFPQCDQTLEIYRKMLFEKNCQRILILAPDVHQIVLAELGFEEDKIGQGRVQTMNGGWGKVAFATKDYSGGDYFLSHLKRKLFKFWKGFQNDFSPGEFPLVFATRSHGASPLVDSPMGAYAVETLLQAKNIPYRVQYSIGEDEFTYQIEGGGLELI